MTRCRPNRTSRALRLLLSVGFAIAAIGVAAQAPAHAISAEGWSLEPTSGHGIGQRDYLQYLVAENEVIHDSVTLSNPTHQPITVDLYPADAFNEPIGGAFALTDINQKPTGPGTWITLATSHLTVPAGKAARIPLTIRIPAQATPGEVAAGVVALNTKVQASKGSGGVGIDIRRALGVRVYMQVAGALRPGLAVTNVSVDRQGAGPVLFGGGNATVSYNVQNTGNTRLDATANVKIVNQFGHTSKSYPPVPLVALLPGARITLTDKWKAPDLGRYRVEVAVTAGTTTASGQTVVWIVPWLFVVILLLLVAGLVWWRRLRSHRRADGRHADSTSVPTNAQTPPVDEPVTSAT
jgi:hypothetical protein